MDFFTSMNVSADGMSTQTQRMKIAAENIANADSVESADGTGPYRAQVVSFKSVLNRATGATTVQVSRIDRDQQTPLQPVYDPANKLANANGFVMHPNVDLNVETVNMKEAQRSYEANMAALTTAKDMATRTLDMLR